MTIVIWKDKEEVVGGPIRLRLFEYRGTVILRAVNEEGLEIGGGALLTIRKNGHLC